MSRLARAPGTEGQPGQPQASRRSPVPPAARDASSDDVRIEPTSGTTRAALAREPAKQRPGARPPNPPQRGKRRKPVTEAAQRLQRTPASDHDPPAACDPPAADTPIPGEPTPGQPPLEGGTRFGEAAAAFDRAPSAQPPRSAAGRPASGQPARPDADRAPIGPGPSVRASHRVMALTPVAGETPSANPDPAARAEGSELGHEEAPRQRVTTSRRRPSGGDESTPRAPQEGARAGGRESLASAMPATQRTAEGRAAPPPDGAGISPAKRRSSSRQPVAAGRGGHAGHG